MATDNRVTSQVVQKGDVGAVYGGVQIERSMTLYEAMKLGGLDFEVKKAPLYVNDRKFIKVDPDEEQAIIRVDNSQFLGTCRSRYHIVQNMDAFKWLEQIVGVNDACVTSAGVLYGGKYTFVCLDLGGFDVLPGDEVRKHMLVLNSHNGKTNVVILMLPYRIHCQNALDFSFGVKGGGQTPFKIRHTGSAHVRLEEIRRVIEFTHDQFDQVQEMFKMFRNTKVTDAQHEMLVRKMLGIPNKVWEKYQKGDLPKRPQWAGQMNDIARRLVEGPGSDVPGVMGSLWNSFNAMNGFYEHDRPVRNSQKNPDVAIQSRLIDDGHHKKIKAFQVCADFARRN